jgi:hypothetical protein
MRKTAEARRRTGKPRRRTREPRRRARGRRRQERKRRIWRDGCDAEYCTRGQHRQDLPRRCVAAQPGSTFFH